MNLYQFLQDPVLAMACVWRDQGARGHLDRLATEVHEAIRASGHDSIPELLRTLLSQVGVGDVQALTDSVEQRGNVVFRSGMESAENLAMEFAKRGLPKIAYRWTGGCGGMSPEHAKMLKILEDACVPLAGYHIFGGTEMRSTLDLSVVPGITDVPVAIRRRNPFCNLVGIVPKIEEMFKICPFLGLIIDVAKDYITRVQPDVNMAVVLQPNADDCFEWDDEYKEAIRLIEKLVKRGWDTLNISFNGGGVTAEEIEYWGRLGQRNEKFRVLLVDGSGRKTEEFANNAEWLAKYPTVHTVACTPEALDAKFRELELPRWDMVSTDKLRLAS